MPEVRSVFGLDSTYTNVEWKPITQKPRELKRPPIAELRRVLSASGKHRLRDRSDVVAWLDSRKIPAVEAPFGVLPPASWPGWQGIRWWPWADRYPVVVPCFDGRGQLITMHARSIDEKSNRWPYGCDSAGALMLDPKWARPWLRGSEAPSDVLIVEGLPDYLAVSSKVPTIGITSGSVPSLPKADRLDGVSIISAVDLDSAGESMHGKILQHMAPHPVYRAKLPR